MVWFLLGNIYDFDLVKDVVVYEDMLELDCYMLYWMMEVFVEV